MGLEEDLAEFRRRSGLIEKASNEAYFNLSKQSLKPFCAVCGVERDEDELQLVNLPNHRVATVCKPFGSRCHRAARRGVIG